MTECSRDDPGKNEKETADGMNRRERAVPWREQEK